MGRGGILPGNAGNAVADGRGELKRLFPFLFAKTDTGAVDDEEALFP